MLRTILIQRINYRLLHLFGIFQPLQIPKQNVILVHTVSKVFKNLCTFRPQNFTLLTIPTTIIASHVLDKIINVNVIIAIRSIVAARCCC